MISRRFCGAIVGLAFVALMVRPALAHHSAAVAYDLSKYITVKGVITEIRWENPHTWIYLDVTDASGTVVNWGFEGAVPNQLARRGITPSILKPGMRVTINGPPARDPSRHFGEVHEVVLEDGRSFVIGAGGTGPPAAGAGGARGAGAAAGAGAATGAGTGAGAGAAAR